MACFTDLMPGSVSIKQLSNKGTFADACRISLDYAHHMVDITGADAAAGAGIAGSRVRAGNIRISTMIDIKEVACAPSNSTFLPSLKIFV